MAVRRIRVIAVSPEYQINLGYIARVMKNFGVTDLRIVNPKCKPLGKDAIKYAKHAHEILRKAKFSKSIREAGRGCGILIGTTAIWHKTEASFFNVYGIGAVDEMAAKAHTIGLVLGREGTGLTKEELAECDANVVIPTDKGYPVMNISHALAVLLFSLSGKRSVNPDIKLGGAADREAIVKLFEKELGRRANIRDKKAVVSAFRHILSRSYATKKELGALAVAFSPKFRTR